MKYFNFNIRIVGVTSMSGKHPVKIGLLCSPITPLEYRRASFVCLWRTFSKKDLYDNDCGFESLVNIVDLLEFY